jgi:hypothetical protein
MQSYRVLGISSYYKAVKTTDLSEEIGTLFLTTERLMKDAASSFQASVILSFGHVSYPE